MLAALAQSVFAQEQRVPLLKQGFLAVERLNTLGPKRGSGIALNCVMRPADVHATPLPAPTAPVGINPHCETESRLVWNDQEHTHEKHEFVYEVSWIPELGAWRRFLRTHRKA